MAAAVSHKHHSIIRVGAGLIQFVFDSHSRLASDLILHISLFSPWFSQVFLFHSGTQVRCLKSSTSLSHHKVKTTVKAKRKLESTSKTAAPVAPTTAPASKLSNQLTKKWICNSAQLHTPLTSLLQNGSS